MANPQKGANMDYLEKLKDPRWQKKRLEIFERDKWTCKICGNKDKPLHVHHIFYFKNLEPWEINDGFLLTACESCHQSETLREVLKDQIGNLLNSVWGCSPFFNSERQCLWDLKKFTQVIKNAKDKIPKT